MKILANKKEHMMSHDNVMAFGAVELEENDKSQTVNMSRWHLEKVLKIIDEMDLDGVQLRVETNMPMLVTNECAPKDNHPLKLQGILISPRIHDDESSEEEY